jgi:hypothetical protein
MHQPTRIQLNYNKDEEGAKEEVMGMVAQKRHPGLLDRQRSTLLVDVLLDVALGHRDAQLQQLTANPLCYPGPVLLCHVLEMEPKSVNAPTFERRPGGHCFTIRGVPFDTPAKAW